MSLKEKLQEMKKGFLAKAPAEAVELMGKATKELIDSGAPAKALKVGDQMPAFSLANQDGEKVDSAALLAKGPLVLSFYRGKWWPYCNLELEALAAVEDQLNELGATLVMVSPELAEMTRNLRRAKKLKSDILVDADNQVAESFALAFTLPDYLKPLYQQFGIDLEKSQGNPNWRLPMPARYVVESSGKVVAAEVNPDYTDRPEPSELVDILKSLPVV